MAKKFDPGLWLRKFARDMFKVARILNTVSHWLSGDPLKIGKHYGRKQGVKAGGNFIKGFFKSLGI